MIKVHAVIYNNDTKSLCGQNISMMEGVISYAYRTKYHPNTHCHRCYRAVCRMGKIIKETECMCVRREGRA